MNWEQVKGVLERIVYFGVMWAVAQKWIPEHVAQDVILAVITIVGIFLGWKVNTAPSLIAASASMSEVAKVVVTEPDLTKLSQPGAKVTTS